MIKRRYFLCQEMIIAAVWIHSQKMQAIRKSSRKTALRMKHLKMLQRTHLRTQTAVLKITRIRKTTNPEKFGKRSAKALRFSLTLNLIHYNMYV